MAVPFLDLKRQYQEISSQIESKLVQVAQSQRYILGPEVEAFEKEIAAYLGVKHAVSVASGTDALILSLKALGVGHNHEVITCDYSFFSSAGVIRWVGARPVFVDVAKNSFNIDPSAIAKKISKKTKAILVVHLFGEPSEMDPVKKLAAKHGLPIIEDACQAIGAEYQGVKIGGMSEAACFSFYPTKVLGCFGDGGLIAANSDQVYRAVQDLRVHGAKGADDRAAIGTNSRLDELQAAILRIKLRKLEAWIKARRSIADKYRQLLAGLPVQTPQDKPHLKHTYNSFVITSEKRDALMDSLRKKEIGCALYYSRPFHLMTAFKKFVKPSEKFPRSQIASQSALALPIFPELRDHEIETVVAAIKQF